jgi:hypothetical protein
MSAAKKGNVPYVLFFFVGDLLDAKQISFDVRFASGIPC